jgi:transposase-like protein
MARNRCWSAETKAKVRHDVETTTLSIVAISEKHDVPAATIGRWIRQGRWQRPDGAPTRSEIDPEKRAALSRVRRGLPTAADVALILECAVGTAEREIASWARPDEDAAHPEPLAAQLCAIREALLRPDLCRTDLVAQVQRVAAYVAADALLRRDAYLDRTALGVARMADRIAALPADERAPGVTPDDEPPESDRSLGELRDELYRRLVGLQQDAWRDRGVHHNPQPEGD